MGFNNMCDSKGSISGKNYLRTFSFLRKYEKIDLDWLLHQKMGRW